MKVLKSDREDKNFQTKELDHAEKCCVHILFPIID